MPPGQDNTKTYADVDGVAPVTVSQLAEILIAKGLSKWYLGTIVCDICYSALGSPPLAKQLARALFRHGYLCSVMGHEGAIFPVYFRYGAVQTNKYEHRIVEKLDGTLVKSNKAQERFWGFN